VSIGAHRSPAVRVQIDPTKLAALGLQMEDVASVITAATVDAPKGSINGPKRSLTIYDNDQLLKAAPWNDVVVAYKNGAPIRITRHRRRGGRPGKQAVEGLAKWPRRHSAGRSSSSRGPTSSTLHSGSKLSCARDAIGTGSIKVDIVANRTTTIRPRSRTSKRTLALTIALVVMVIFLFLRSAWATIIPGVTVPLSLLGTAAVMYVLNYSLDNLSLMALTIAVGFVVDDAIVMLENIYRHIEAGMSPLDATSRGRARSVSPS